MNGLEILGDAEGGVDLVGIAAVLYYVRRAILELSSARKAIEAMRQPPGSPEPRE